MRRVAEQTDPRVAAWLATFASANTQAAYRRDLAVFAGWFGEDLATATAPDIEAFRTACLAHGDAAATAGRRIASLASFYRHLLGSVPPAPDAANPVAPGSQIGAPSGSTTDPLDAHEAAQLWAAIRHDARTATLVGLLLHDGFKLHEAIGLRMDALRPTRDAVHVLLPRRGTLLTLRLDDRTGAAARRLRAARTDRPDELLLRGRDRNGMPTALTRSGADYVLRQAGVAAGLDAALTSNRLRMTHIRTASDAGRSLDDVARRVGHATVRSTRRFLV